MRRVVVFLIPLLLLAACGGTTTPQLHRPTTSESAKSRSRVIAKGDEYVAIGDSYVAAPYTAAAVADDGCLQSSQNYPHQLATQLGLKLTDVSCGGAITASVTEKQKTSTGVVKPPQVDALSSKTALVTVGIGGNDGNLAAAVTTGCLAFTKLPSGHPCATLDSVGHKAHNGTSDKIATMQVDLENALEAIIKRAPHARVIVVSYPGTTPSHPCSQYPIADGDVTWAHRVTRKLADAQRAAAKAVGAEFLDMYDAAAGHDMCSSQPWTAGEHPTAAAAPFHPYAIEQAAVVTGLKKALKRH